MKFEDNLKNLQEAYQDVMLKEKYDVDFLTDKIIDKKYKGMKITNAVYDDKAGTMIKFWVEDKGKIKEIRPIPKDELVRVLK
jgi:phosphorylcholine metabolism protein LicD